MLRVGFEPTGNGVEIEDCSALAVVSKGTVPPGVNLPTSNLESGRPTIEGLKNFWNLYVASGIDKQRGPYEYRYYLQI